MKSVIDAIRTHPGVLDVLTDDELAALASRCSLVQFPKDAVLFRERDPGDYMAVITEGKVDVRKELIHGGRPMLIAVLSAGSTVGEFSLLDAQPRTATVVATEDTECVILDKASLEEYSAVCPGGAVKIYRTLGQLVVLRLRKAMERIAVMS